jgi:hypothetical protein
MLIYRKKYLFNYFYSYRLPALLTFGSMLYYIHGYDLQRNINFRDVKEADYDRELQEIKQLKLKV